MTVKVGQRQMFYVLPTCFAHFGCSFFSLYYKIILLTNTDGAYHDLQFWKQFLRCSLKPPRQQQRVVQSEEML